MTAAYRIALAFWLTMAGNAATSAELELEGSTLHVVGMLDGTALPAFLAHIEGGRVRTVAFENSIGGTPEVAQAYAKAIREKGLVTEARGQCHAACAFAFLAGREHRFGRGAGYNALLIPAARRPSPGDLQASRWGSDEPARSAVEVVPVSATASPTTASKDEAWSPGQGVVFTSTPTLFGRIYNTYWCDGTQGTDFTRCERLSDADPYKLGVLTR